MIKKEFLERFRRLQVASISDAVDKLGFRGFMYAGIKPIFKNIKIVGPAVTVKYAPARRTLPPMHAIEAIDTAKPGDVLILAGGDPDVAFFGGLMATASKEKGLEGVVTDGGTRDLREIEEMKFPVFARSVVPSTSVGRYETVASNVRVSCGGVSVNPGDIVVGNDDGVIVVPKESMEKVLEYAEAAEKKEVDETRDLKKGMPLSEVIKKYARI